MPDANQMLPVLVQVGIPVLTALGGWLAKSWISRRGALIEIQKAITEVKSQIYPNGGGSLRDAIDQMKFNLTALMEGQWAHHFHDPRPRWETDEQCAILRCNSSFAKRFGASIEELKGHGWMTYIHPEDRQTIQEVLKNAHAYGYTFTLQARLIKRGKETPPTLNMHWTRVRILDRKLIGFVGTLLEEME